ncbi:MAG: MBL fold metallo-hydrolase [Sphingomonadales bacterium]
MASSIPFIADEQTQAGIVYRPAPGLRRLVAANPGPFTYTGTGTYVLGATRLAVIDPGPALPDHIAGLRRLIDGAGLEAIIVTHNHRDHSPAAAALKAATGAPILGCAPLSRGGDGGHADEGLDTAYRPDRVLADGETIAGDGWTLRTLATPGHISNHLCFEWLEANALFSGDHVMGWSTSVVLPPEGDMGDYVASLKRVRDRDYDRLWPTHGQPVDQPGPFIDALIAHRRAREEQILACLEAGLGDIAAIVARLYQDVPNHLHGAAGQSVLAHLIDLCRRGLVTAEPAPEIDAVYHLRGPGLATGAKSHT